MFDHRCLSMADSNIFAKQGCIFMCYAQYILKKKRGRNVSTVERALNSIGKSNFVEYFEDYKELALSKEKLTGKDKMPLAEKLLENNPDATKLSGQMIRISSAITIFKNDWSADALRLVVNSKHSSITDETKEKASLILKRI